jgi:hypothetical protein
MAKAIIKAPSMTIKGASPFVGFQMYTPAIIAFVGYLIMALVILLPFEYPVYDEVNDKTYIVKYDFGQRLLTLLLMSIPIALSVYTINCMMAGQCVVWSYVVSIMTVLWIALFVIAAFVYTFGKK